MPVPVPRWDAPLRLLGDAGIQEPIRKKNGGGGGQVRAFSFSGILATRHPNHISLLHPCVGQGYHLPPILVLRDSYQFLLLGQTHTSGTEGTRILRLSGPKEILENIEVNRVAMITMMV